MESLINESGVMDRMNEQAEQAAHRYFSKYRSHMELLESHSLLSKVRSITPYDFYALGKQLENFEAYKSMCEDDGTLSQLGKIPNVAFDVITVAYGTAPISALASVQPIDEERGTVYFKNVIAQTTRGNVTAGDNIAKSDAAPDAFPEGYASDQLTEVVGTLVAATTGYVGLVSAAGLPIRPFTTKVRVVVGGVERLVEDTRGDGTLVGAGGDFGTIDYAGGGVTLDLGVAQTPGAGDAGNPISVTYQTDFAQQTEIPKIIMRLTTKSVNARVWALKDTIGLEQSYALRRRFGLIAEDEVATDLVSAINSEITRSLIKLLEANSTGPATLFPKTPPAGVSFFEHKQTFKDSLAEAESVMLGNAGRGMISSIVAGRDVCAILGTLPGFVKLSDGSTIGSHIYGTLDGATVVRVPYDEVLDTNRALLLYKGTSPFEAPAVYAPYMPLVVTTALPTGANPLLNQKAAAVWSAIESLVPNFITTLDVTP